MKRKTFNPKKWLGGSVVPEWLETRSELSWNAKGVYARLARHVDRSGKARAGKGLCGEVGLDAASVRSAGKELLEANLLERGEDDGGGFYRFIWHDWMTVEQKKGKKRRRVIPTQEEVEQYFIQNGYRRDVAQKAYAYYAAGGWVDAAGKPVLAWKQKMIAVWFRDEHRVAGVQSKKSTWTCPDCGMEGVNRQEHAMVCVNGKK
jgi:hypothetical protein